MTRKALVLTLACCAAFAAGALTTKPAKKFPYVSDELNKPCGKTVFEWRCMANRIQQEPKPIRLCREFDVLHFIGTPLSQSLVVKANLTRRPGIQLSPKDRMWWRVIEIATRRAYDQAKARFADSAAFEDWRHFRLELYVDAQPVAIRTFDGLRPLTP